MLNTQPTHIQMYMYSSSSTHVHDVHVHVQCCQSRSGLVQYTCNMYIHVHVVFNTSKHTDDSICYILVHVHMVHVSCVHVYLYMMLSGRTFSNPLIGIQAVFKRNDAYLDNDDNGTHVHHVHVHHVHVHVIMNMMKFR